MCKKIQFLIFFILLAKFCFALEGPVTLQTLTQASDRIVRGRVMNLSYSLGTNEFGDELIFTNVSIHVAEALKGERSDFILTVEGGTLNGITLTVSDAPEFKTGEDVLLFAKKDLLTYRPLSGYRSKYTISTNGTVVENGQYYGSFKKTIMQLLRNPRSSK